MMNVREQIASNKRKTWLIMFIATAVIMALSWLLATFTGYSRGGALGYVGFALVLAGVINFSSYYFSDKIVLKMTGAKEVSEKEAPELLSAVRSLAQRAQIPLPRTYIINDPTPNAFATGRDPKHAAVAVHTGLIARLDKKQLEGVLAHELSHIKNLDTRIMAIMAMLAGTLAILADFFMRSTLFGRSDEERDNRSNITLVVGIVAALITPIAAQLIQLAVSRRREFLADASGAYLTRHPEGLASALLKISSVKHPSPTAHTGTAHMYISNPLGGGRGTSWLVKLFMTHPPVEERVKALRTLRW